MTTQEIMAGSVVFSPGNPTPNVFCPHMDPGLCADCAKLAEDWFAIVTAGANAIAGAGQAKETLKQAVAMYRKPA